MTRSRLSVLVLAVMTALTVTTVPSAADARAPWSCKLIDTGMQDFLWSSNSDGRWSDGSGWVGGVAPAGFGTSSYACIQQAVTVTLGPEAGRVDLAAFELGNQTTLRLEPGTELYVWGDEERRSLARAGSVIEVRGATFGGPGAITLRGTLQLLPDGDRAARLATGTGDRPIEAVEPQLLVDDQARVEVMGAGASYLSERYDVQVRGWVGIGGPQSERASLAADHGTAFTLVPQKRRHGVGTLALLNDQGYSEGDDPYGLPLSTFVNRGLIEKVGDLGVSRIAAAYSSEGRGSIQVEQGSLMLPYGTFTRALVGPGATFGSGVCDQEATDCGNGTTQDRQQTATLTVPYRGHEDVSVVVTQVDEDVTKVLGTPVKAHASGDVATRAAPYVIELRYDATLLGGRTWQDLRVRHKDGGRSYSVVPTCLKTGDIPPTSDACVDRGGDPDNGSRVLTGDSAGDVVMVVRTIRTSRWIAY